MRRAALGTVAALALLAAPAGGVIPSAGKIADAIASANRKGGRAKPVLLELDLSIGDGGVAASGVLATHPTGLARLELKSRRGFVERHLLQGNAHSASRDGELLDRPHPFLPPVFLLQSTSGAALSAALESYGVASERTALGRIGEHDCYVFGGRLPPKDGRERVLPSLWVDLESYEVVRVDRPDGVRFEFGPHQVFEGGIRAPRWIRIEAPGQPASRLEILRVVPANAPAAAFGFDWLTAPPAALDPGDPAARSGLMQPDRHTE